MRCKTSRFRWGSPGVLIAIVLSLAAETSRAAEPETERDRVDGERLLRAVANERDRIRSGLVTITGTRVHTTPDQPDVTGPVRSLYAFDFDKNWFRYDNEERQRMRIASPSNLPDGRLTKEAINNIEPAVLTRYLSYIRNDDYSLKFTRDGDRLCSNLTLREPTTELGKGISLQHHYCDLRAAGLMRYEDFRRFVSPETIVDKLVTSRVDRVRSKDGRWEIRCVAEYVESDLTIDTSDGFRPVSRVTHFRPVLRLPGHRTRTLEFEYRTEAEWQRRDGVDVPVRLTMTSSGEGHQMKYDLRLKWKKVNEPLDQKWFNYRNLPNVPTDGGVIFFDARGGMAEPIGIWRGNGRVDPWPPDRAR